MSDMSFTDFDFELDKAKQLASQDVRALDNQLHVRFYKHAEKNSFQSKEQGRPIFEEHVYIEILTPANRLNIINRRATDEDKTRFNRQYLAFLAGQEQLASGTPLSELPTITAAQVMELKALKMDTVEQLAGVADSTVQLLGTGGQELKQRAIRYLARTADAEALSEQNRTLMQELIELRKANQQLLEGKAATESVKITQAIAK